MGVLVKGRHCLEGGAVGGKERGMRFGSESIDHGSEVLVRNVLHVEGQVRWPSDGEIRPDAPTMLRNGSDEQAHWSRNSVALVGPLTPGSSATGGGQGSMCGAVLLMAMAPRTPRVS